MGKPATPVPAATVILVRDGPVSPEVLMLERHSRSVAFPDLYVFPGGRADDADGALAERLGGLAEAGAKETVPHLEPELVAALLVTAIRETFEEAGILLARPRGGKDLVDADRASALSRYRRDVQEGRRAFGELLDAEGLVLATDGLAVHAHWITPEFMPRRYDTLFFTSLAPAGQRAAHDGVESTAHVWIRPEAALAQAERRERQIIFPTLCNLETLSGFRSAAEALAASRARRVIPVLPRLVEQEGQRKLVIPEDAGYVRYEGFVGTSPP